MTDLATPNAYGALTEPATLTIERLLPGPIERVWAYLTESELRRKWLAAGPMEMKVGAPFEFVWRNLRRLGVAESALRDSAQEVFLIVHRRLGEFEGRGTLRAWLYSILRRVAADERRWRRRTPART